MLAAPLKAVRRWPKVPIGRQTAGRCVYDVDGGGDAELVVGEVLLLRFWAVVAWWRSLGPATVRCALLPPPPSVFGCCACCCDGHFQKTNKCTGAISSMGPWYNMCASLIRHDPI